MNSKLDLAKHNDKLPANNERLLQASTIANPDVSVSIAQQQSFVSEQLATIQLFDKRIIFPNEKPTVLLTSVAYTQFITLLNNKFKKVSASKKLDELVVPSDNAAIEGLMDYINKGVELPFETLSLDLTTIEFTHKNDTDSFLFKLEQLLVRLSSCDLTQVKLMTQNNSLPENFVKQLVNLVNIKKVAIAVILPPPYQTSVYQRDIDDVISDTSRKKHYNSLTIQAIPETSCLDDTQTIIRRRIRRSAKQQATIDIELQQEQQHAQQVEMAVETRAEENNTHTLSLEDSTLLTIFEFASNLYNGEFDNLSKSYLIPSDIDQALQYFANLMGNFSLQNAGLNKIKLSLTAAEKILAHSEKFQFGLDFKRLPAGFSCVKKERERIIGYSEAARLVAEDDLLAIHLNDHPQLIALTYSQMRQWLDMTDNLHPAKIAWNTLSQTIPYNREACYLFKQYLPRLLSLSDKDINTVLTLCKTHDTCLDKDRFKLLLDDKNKLQQLLISYPKDNNTHNRLASLFGEQKANALSFLTSVTEINSDFDHHLLKTMIGHDDKILKKVNQLLTTHPSLGLDPLLQLYIEFGEGGIDTLTSVIATIDKDNHKLFDKLNQQVFLHQQSYAALLTENYKDAINAINGFSKAESAWWNSLLDQHVQAQKEVNLVDLVNAFKAFQDKLRKLPVTGEELVLTDSCAFTGVKSLPVTLSRILTLLEHTSEDNRQAQWAEITTLDFSSTGIIKAINPDLDSRPWAFITNEMTIKHIKPLEPLAIAKQFSLGDRVLYHAPYRWKTIYDNDIKTVEKFFRYVATQEKGGQLPLEFYQHVHQTLENNNLSSSVKHSLYTLLAGATTQIKNVKITGSLTDAKKDFDTLITLLKNPIPLLDENRKESVRNGLLGSLLSLDDVPPLPVFSRLTNVILSSFRNPLILLTNIVRLQQANKDLTKNVKNYGSVVYEGMKAYQNDDFEKTELFFDYLKVVNKIAEEFKNREEDSYQAASLISIISSFQLNEQTINAVLKDFLSQPIKEGTRAALVLLRKLSVNDEFFQKNPLTHHDLIVIFEATTTQTDLVGVIDVFKTLLLPNKQALHKYFSEILDSYGHKAIPKDVSEKINSHFTAAQSRQLTKLLYCFSADGDSMCYSRIIDQIIAITKTPLSAHDKNSFIAKLSSTNELYTNVMPLTDERHSFVALLDTIIGSGSPNDFINFITIEKKLSEQHVKQRSNDSTPNLTTHYSDKAYFYLKLLLPGIKKINFEVLSDLEVIPRAIATLLKMPVLVQQEQASYQEKFQQIFTKINAITTKNPGCEQHFLALYDSYLKQYLPIDDGELLAYQLNFLQTLEEMFTAVKDKTIPLSLCLQFNKNSLNNEEMQPKKLLALLNAIKIVNNKDNQSILLKVAVSLINNNKDYSLADMIKIIAAVNETPLLATFLKDTYAKAPFPTLKQVMVWHETALKNQVADDYLAQITAFYKTYSQYPCSRNSNNGFDTQKAYQLLKEFKGIDITALNIDLLAEKIQAMRGQSPSELLAILKTCNTQTSEASIDYETLVAVTAELLHISTGTEKDSMELNTAQYLAIYTSLKTAGHVTSQIYTGEGKTRISMVEVGCLWALGKTVDFVTADLPLAIRDFVKFQAFFEMIDAKTSLIYAHTNPAFYQVNGINFSDCSNLNLLRNKAHSLGQEALVLDEVAGRRALFIDEADKIYFDLAHTRFNFSKEGNQAIQGMDWVYPLLMDYFAGPKIRISDDTYCTPLDLYYEDVAKSREKFLQFASIQCSNSQLMRFKVLSPEQIEQWQVAAVTANELVFNQDFVIKPDELINTPTGPIIASEAQLLIANRVAPGAKLSFGVHQCLHARLNKSQRYPIGEQDEKLKATLATCTQAFHIADEKQIIYSSTSKNLIDEYVQGTIKAVTGTSGSPIEREEARKLYGKQDEEMQFIDVPRFKEFKRQDKFVRLTKNQAQKIEVLIAQINQARARKQPMLIIAENDADGVVLFNELEKKLKTNIQHIHSKLSLEEEQTKLALAGCSGQITVSTNMIGRGTDISLNDDANSHGLNVMVTYLPMLRDLEQIIGRAGRFGAPGESSIVLTKEQLEQSLGKKELSSKYFYTDMETYVLDAQLLMEKEKQKERLIANAIGDFRLAFTKEVFTAIKEKSIEKGKMLPLWSDYSEKVDKVWNEMLPFIKNALASDKVNVDNINQLLKTYQEKISSRRSVLHKQMPESKNKTASKTLQLSNVAEKLISDKNKQDIDVHYNYYERGHDGRHVNYTHWYIPVVASLKGFANLIPGVDFETARPPFANTRAWLNGHGQLFPDFRASPNKGKIIGVTVASLVMAAIGVTLVLTGLLVPFGITVWGIATAAILLGIAGGITGAMIVTTSGVVVDEIFSPSIENTKEQIETNKLGNNSTQFLLKSLSDLPKATNKTSVVTMSIKTPIPSKKPTNNDTEENKKEISCSFSNK